MRHRRSPLAYREKICLRQLPGTGTPSSTTAAASVPRPSVLRCVHVPSRRYTQKHPQQATGTVYIPRKTRHPLRGFFKRSYMPFLTTGGIVRRQVSKYRDLIYIQQTQAPSAGLSTGQASLGSLTYVCPYTHRIYLCLSSCYGKGTDRCCARCQFIKQHFSYTQPCETIFFKIRIQTPRSYE